MAVPQPSRPAGRRPEVAPALFRLLAESALSRAALDACGVPLVLADAAAENAISYVNRAFEVFFGYRAAEALGRPAANLLFTDAAAAVRGVDGRVTHWVLAFSDRSELEELRAKLSRPST
jgi:PAS domain-containing protein